MSHTATLLAASAAAILACSSSSKDSGTVTSTVESACDHLNDLCSNTQGFTAQDCSATNAKYEQLSAAQKSQADQTAPCILGAKSCQVAIDCVNPPTNSATTTPASNDADAAAPATPQDACEHINDVCVNQQGFTKQDCSNSNSAYANLSAADKQTADGITPCIMSATGCAAAVQCLQTN